MKTYTWEELQSLGVPCRAFKKRKALAPPGTYVPPLGARVGSGIITKIDAAARTAVVSAEAPR